MRPGAGAVRVKLMIGNGVLPIIHIVRVFPGSAHEKPRRSWSTGLAGKCCRCTQHRAIIYILFIFHNIIYIYTYIGEVGINTVVVMGWVGEICYIIILCLVVAQRSRARAVQLHRLQELYIYSFIYYYYNVCTIIAVLYACVRVRIMYDDGTTGPPQRPPRCSIEFNLWQVLLGRRHIILTYICVHCNITILILYCACPLRALSGHYVASANGRAYII